MKFFLLRVVPVLVFLFCAFASAKVVNAQILGSTNITAPTEGQVITIGKTFEIKWDKETFEEDLDISLHGYNITTGEYVGGFIKRSVSNTGSYKWDTSRSLTVDDDLLGDYTTKLGTGYSYKIVILGEANTGSNFGYTKEFSLLKSGDDLSLVSKPSIKLLSPNNGESFKIGDKIPITWVGSYVNLSSTMYVVASIGDTSLYIAKDVPISTGTVYWDTTKSFLNLKQAYEIAKPGEWKLVIGATDLTAYDYADQAIKLTDATGVIPNAKPRSFVDNVDASGMLNGWAFDPDFVNSAIKIHVYFDSPADPTKTSSSTTTFVSRPDVNTAFGLTGSHGFRLPIPEMYHDGKIHRAYVYGIDGSDPANNNAIASNSPFSFTVKNKPLAHVTDGDLFVDNGTIYVIEYGVKRPFPSMTVFNQYYYSLKNVIPADLSGITSGAVMVANGRHPRGAAVLINGTVYFMGANNKYPFNTETVFNLWGLKFEQVVKANAADLTVPDGPIMTPPGTAEPGQISVNPDSGLPRDAKSLADVRQIMTALELYWNDHNTYPTTAMGLAALVVVNYLSSVPAPTPAGSCTATTYLYTSPMPNMYSMKFCLENPSGGFAAGEHYATEEGLQ